MLHDNAKRLTSAQHAGLNVFTALKTQHISSHQTRSRGPHQKTQCDVEIGKSWSQHKHDQDRKEQKREGRKHLDNKGNDCIHTSAKITCRNTCKKADKQRQRLRNDANRKRNSAAVNNTGKNIASKFIGTKPMRGIWAFEHVGKLLRIRIERTQKRRRECNQT